MPATPARIGFILEQFRRATVEDATVQTRFGSLARKSDDPVPTFFDRVDDAEAVAQERLDLLSRVPRLFTVEVRDIASMIDLPLTGTMPLARYVDIERDCDRDMVVTNISFDPSRNSATVTLWG